MSNYIHGKTRLVVCAANKYGEYIYLGVRHFCPFMCEAMENDDIDVMRQAFGEIQGFVDQHGVFMDRFEALTVATEAGQINRYREKTTPIDRLFSEDLY